MRVEENQLDAAASLYLQALRNYESVGGSEHPSAAQPLLGLAAIELRRRQATKAEEYSRRAHSILLEHFPAGHWRTASAAVVLGRSLLASGKPDEAGSTLATAHERLRALFGDRDPRTRNAREAVEEHRRYVAARLRKT
jgi:hypothetical protein